MGWVRDEWAHPHSSTPSGVRNREVSTKSARAARSTGTSNCLFSGINWSFFVGSSRARGFGLLIVRSSLR
jgi:hypothetical protein